MKTNPRDELIRILEYLDQPVNHSRLDCLVKAENVEGPFHRHHHSDSFNNSTTGSETKEKNLVNFSKKPGWNSKSWKNGEQQSLVQAEENMSPNNHYQPPLDLIVQDNIDKINRFFAEKGIPILLDYTGPSACCST